EAYILPSLYEGMPTVILEAMANGLPIIATDIGAVRTMVDEENGLVIPPGSPQAIVDAVRHLFVTCSPQERRRMGEVSYQRVRAAFTWQQIARQTRDLLEELLDRKEEPRAS
ncbi:MAG: glycosyltransferase, partial [Deltaproteobacteria bacterium]